MKKIIFSLSPFSSCLSFSFSGRRPNLFSLPADLFPSSSAWLTLQKLFNLWQNKFVTDHWKIIINHDVSMMISDIMDWASHIKSIGGLTKTRHTDWSNLWCFLMSWIGFEPVQHSPGSMFVMKINVTNFLMILVIFRTTCSHYFPSVKQSEKRWAYILKWPALEIEERYQRWKRVEQRVPTKAHLSPNAQICRPKAMC